jgi:DNA polymerase-4
VTDPALPCSTIRKIIHVDMDAFYASVEQRDDPALRGKPVAVGGGHRGVVAAASYEARVFGVRSQCLRSRPAALPRPVVRQAAVRRLQAGQRADRAIFADYTDLIEPLSLDEAYLDVSEDRRGLGSARAIAEDIRRRIRVETGLTASAGVSYCKFIAKLASDHNKPDGICVIPPHKGAAFVATLPVKRFHGSARLRSEDGAAWRHTGADLAAWSLPELTAHFGSSGEWYWRIARGIDERPVRSDRAHKSVSAERTFDQDLTEPAALAAESSAWRDLPGRGSSAAACADGR